MIQLQELHRKEEIQNPVLKHMVDYTREADRVFLFVVTKGGEQKGVMIGTKTKDSELQMTYFGSHYLLETVLPLYKEALREKLAHLS